MITTGQMINVSEKIAKKYDLLRGEKIMSSKTIHIINEILSWIVSGGLVLVVVAVVTFAFYQLKKQQDKELVVYRAQLIQELCERSDYDFCEIEKIIYKERVEEDVDK